MNVADSIMIRNFEHNICVAISGVQGLLETREFSMHRECIKVQQQTNGHLDVELFDKEKSVLNNL